MFLGPGAQKHLYIKVLGTQDPPGPKNLIKTNVFGPWVQTQWFLSGLGALEGDPFFWKKPFEKTDFGSYGLPPGAENLCSYRLLVPGESTFWG